MPKFSIIIPVYNVEDYLDYCVQSVLRQTVTDFEIVLVNDGSTDKSGEICDKWSECDQRVYVIHQPNGGLSAARNSGLRIASGKYILFLDSDDYWLSDKVLERIDNRLMYADPDVLVFNLQKDFAGKLHDPYFSEAIQTPNHTEEKSRREYVFANNLWTACAWNKAVRRTLFEGEHLKFRENVTAEDVDWCYRLALYANSIDFLNVCVVGYRQRKGSITGSITIEKFRSLLGNIQLCLEINEEKENESKNDLLGYLAYQYGVLLHGYALLPRSKEKRDIFPAVKSLQFLLNYAREPKTLLIRNVKCLLGLKTTLVLLRIRACGVNVRNKRGE